MELKDRHKILIVAGVVLVFMVFIWWGMRPGNSDLPPLDPYDYKSVALHFMYENGKIVRRMGKITRSSQVGDGGKLRVTHNVFQLYGVDDEKQTSGVCDITLERDDEDKYVVTKAILTMQGNEFNIPVKGFKDRGKGMKIF